MKHLKRAAGFLKRVLGKRTRRPRAGSPFDSLQTALGYTFVNQALLKHSLTHKSSIVCDGRNSHLQSNERLEFLGDSILNCCVTEHIYEVYPSRTEGQLSKIKSLIVSRKILGEVADSINLGDYMILGHSERDSGGREKKSIMSNAFEAVIGAVYLDGGLAPVQKALQLLLFPRIEGFLGEECNVNHKSKILEMSQRDGFGIPRYTVLSTWGPEHAKTFQVQIEIAGVPLGVGSGPNKKIAEQNAAQGAAAEYSKETILATTKREVKHELVSH